jgi:hypothetical protein
MKIRSSFRRMLFYFVLLQIVLLRADRAVSRHYDESEAYRVYSDMLSDRYFANGAERRWLIETETADAGYDLSSDSLEKCFPAQNELDFSNWQSLLDLKRETRIPRLLEDHFDSRVHVGLVSRDRPDAEINENGVLWAGFEERYSDYSGILSLSSVGFNDTKDRALVYVSFVCGNLCGGAHFYTLEKRHGVWQITEPAASCVIYY